MNIGSEDLRSPVNMKDTLRCGVLKEDTFESSKNGNMDTIKGKNEELNRDIEHNLVSTNSIAKPTTVGRKIVFNNSKFFNRYKEKTPNPSTKAN